MLTYTYGAENQQQIHALKDTVMIVLKSLLAKNCIFVKDYDLKLLT